MGKQIKKPNDLREIMLVHDCYNSRAVQIFPDRNQRDTGQNVNVTVESHLPSSFNAFTCKSLQNVLVLSRLCIAQETELD